MPPALSDAPGEQAASGGASHWSLQPIERPGEPAVGSPEWVRNPIDSFVLQRLEEAGLVPAPQAEPQALLRRVTLDLTGLPPSAEELERFASDPSDAAYEAAVDRLLDDPAFGEHRAHYWLDAARYADTHGYHRDDERSIWPYRDYVIGAFEQGKPFDQFTVEQLAGDLLEDATPEQRAATGFIRNAMSTNEEGVNLDEYEAIYAKDRVETLAAVWLGLTVGCAACHDHKFDPVTQREFYALTAFFRNSTQPTLDGNVKDAPPTVHWPEDTPTLVTAERAGRAKARVLVRGRFDAPGDAVRAAVPRALPPLPAGAPENRLGLARWLMSDSHPLVARVTANRFWSEVFGAGLVRTAHDFGRSGEAPTHPALLDWIAAEFRDSGWDVKHLLRLFVTSATYRQAAAASELALELDPDNRLLSRGPRFRMDAEMVRDLALCASGLLVRRVGGPSVRPYQPANVWEAVSDPESSTASYEQDSGDALYRRSLYTFWKRQAPPPSLELFNAPNREQVVVARERSNTPLQALVTLNDVQFVEAARVLAARAMIAVGDDADRLGFISLRILARTFSDGEASVLFEHLELQRAHFAEHPELAEALAGAGESPRAELDAAELAAWSMTAHLIFNLDEALNK